ncbi:MAG TPA: TonB-dependent receptor [Gemmatimonadaceae bacterium]
MSARRMIRVLASMTFLAVPASGSAQTGTVTGTVTEGRANMPVAGARVQALTATTVVAATQSRDDGTYLLTVPAGTYTIIANRIGYRPGNTSVTVTAGGSATANVVLAEAIVELNPVVTVASRREEKALDAPASVSVIEVRNIQERPAVTAADHVQGIAGVDVSKGGIAQSNIVTRGFNNAFSGSLLTLQDYRFAGVPSLRVNVPLLFTSTNEDIERIEVLLGPASALYGPNSSHGVLHVITKSPFTSQGTTLTVDGGTRSLFRGSARHAGLIGDRLGFKLSGEYFRASDFEFDDPGEPAVFPAAAPPGRAGQPNVRDFDIERTVGEARLDFRPNENSEYVTTYGFSQIGSGLEYTGANGTAFAKGWTYQSIQQRARIGRLFGQVFLNMSDAGNDNAQSTEGTYLLRSGQPIVDQSRSWAAQLQHGASLGAMWDFVYGLDYISTNPRTGNTINGRNEDIDDVTEYGGYVQSTARLTPKFDVVGALRIDKNDQVEGYQTSPRAALIFKPSETQNFRVTYNRAFQTPANFTWFLDLIQARNLGGTPYNIRALGNPPKTGWSFNRSCEASVNDGLCMRSIFTPDSSQWVPASAAAAYRGAILANSAALTAGLAPQIQAGLGVSPQAAQAVATQLVTFLGSLQPTATQVGSQLRMFPPGSPLLTAEQVRDVGPIKASFNNTYELGYKGIIGNRLRLSVDAWREKRGDVGNPADLTTPNVFFDSTSMKDFMQAALIPAITQTLMGPPFNMSQQQAAATAQAFGPQVAAGVAQGLKPLPLGIVSFNSPTFASATDVYATYTSYDATVTVNGIDLALDFVANANWSFNGTLSWVDNDSFPEVVSSNRRPLMLNAPTNKLSLGSQYRSSSGAWGVDARLRHTNAYPVNSGVYATDVDFAIPGSTGTYRYDDVIDAATIFDIGFNYRFEQRGRSALFSIRADNLFDEKYRTMPGAPELGRMIVTRVQYSF